MMLGEIGHDEETTSCSCGFIGFKRSQVFDCNTNEINYEDSEELFEINLKEPLDTICEDDCESSVFSFDIHKEKDVVHVAVDHVGESSMEALLWTLKHVVTPSTTVYLVHVFPQIKLIPSPLGAIQGMDSMVVTILINKAIKVLKSTVGKFPRSRVNPDYVNFHLTEQKGKIKVLLQKFIDLCLDSKVTVEMMLIEDDNIAKAITDLVRDHNIRKLVIGITKSNLSRMTRESVSRRRKAIADKVLKNAPENCDIKIVCDGKEVIDEMLNFTSSCSNDSSSSKVSLEENEPHGFVPLMRFVPNPMWSFRPRF